MTESYHLPVLGPETVAFFAEVPPGSIVDATFGGGGHTRLLLDLRPDIDVIALDRDPDAGSQVPDDPRLRLVRATFGSWTTTVTACRTSSPVTGIGRIMAGMTPSTRKAAGRTDPCMEKSLS